MQHEICDLDTERHLPPDGRAKAADHEVVRLGLQEHSGMAPHIEDQGGAKIEE